MVANSSNNNALNGLGELGLGNELAGDLSTNPFEGLRDALQRAAAGMQEQQIDTLDGTNPLEIDPNDLFQGLESDGPLAEGEGSAIPITTGIDSLTGRQYAAQGGRRADLVGQLQAVNLPDVAVPGDDGKVTLQLSNQGTRDTKKKSKVRVFALSNDDPGAAPVLLGEKNLNLNLKVGQSKRYSVQVETPADLAPGSYVIYAEIDANNRVKESNEGNNLVVINPNQQVTWQFGDVGERDNVKLEVKDSRGKTVRFELQGRGYGEITGGGDFSQIILHDTDESSTFKIRSIGGNHESSVGEIIVHGSLNKIDARTTDLRNGINVSGAIRELKLDDVLGPQTIHIGSNVSFDTHKATIQMDRVEDLTLLSGTRIKELKVTEWLDTDGEPDKLMAPRIDKLTVKGSKQRKIAGDFEADFHLGELGQEGVVLNRADIAGESSGTWHLEGEVSERLNLGSTSEDWSANVQGPLKTLKVDGDLSGTLAIRDGLTGQAHIKGDLDNAHLLVGTDLGHDHHLGGTEENADRFTGGSLNRLRVDGDVFSSIVGVGIDPVDGIFGNGNDYAIDGEQSRLGAVTVKGELSDDSRVMAGELPNRVRVDGEAIRGAEVDDDPRFVEGGTPPKATMDPAIQMPSILTLPFMGTESPTAFALGDEPGFAQRAAAFSSFSTFASFSAFSTGGNNPPAPDLFPGIAAGHMVEEIEFNNRLIQTVRGSDDSVYMRDSSDGGATWSEWQVPAGGQTLETTRFTQFGNQLFQTARGVDSFIYSRSSSDGVTWSNWQAFGAGWTVDQPEIVAFNGRLYQSVRGGDNNLYMRSSSDGQNWTSWQADGNGLITLERPDLVEFNGVLVQTIRSQADVIQTRTTTDGVTWSSWQSTVGIAASSIESETFNNQLFQTVLGTNNQTFLRSTSDGVTWTGWTPLLTQAVVEAPQLFKRNGELFQRILTADNQFLLRSTSDGVTWSNFQVETSFDQAPEIAAELANDTGTSSSDGVTSSAEVHGTVLDYNPPVVADASSSDFAMVPGVPSVPDTTEIREVTFSGQVYQSFRGDDGAIYTRSSSDRVTWSDWQDDGGLTLDAPGMSVFQNKLYQSIRGIDNGVYLRSSSDGQTWSDWQSYGGFTHNSPALEVFNGQLYQSVRGIDNLVYQRSSSDGVTWSNWQYTGGVTLDAPTLQTFNNKLYQSVRGASNILYMRHTSDGQNWSAWQSLGATTIGSSGLAVYNNQLFHATRTIFNQVISRSSSDGINWSPWQVQTETGFTLADPNFSEYGGELVQTFQAPTGQVLSITSTDGTNWSGWQASSSTFAPQSTLASVKASLNGSPETEVLSLLNEDGSFSFDREQLQAIYRGALLDGDYTLTLQATDEQGNASELTEISFVLDTTAPELVIQTPLAKTPDNGAENSAWARLIGQVSDEGEGPIVVDVSLSDQATQTTTTQTINLTTSDGQASFDQLLNDAALNPGSYSLTLSAQDAAGNETVQTHDFEVTNNFEIQPNTTQAWAAADDQQIILGEQDGFVVQKAISIELGQTEGSRTLSFDVDAVFDTSDGDAAQEDRLAIYLVDSQNPTQTLLDGGEPGSALFALAGETAEFRAGQVRFDGRRVQVDLTSLGDLTTGQLVVQLLNHDGDSGSTVTLSNITNEVDPEGTSSLLFPVRGNTATPGAAMDLSGLSPAAAEAVDLRLSDVRLDTATGLYQVDVQVKNDGEALGRNVAVVFSNLPSGVTLTNASGTDADGNPYINLRNGIRAGGLDKGAISDAIQLEFSNPNLARLDLNAEVLVGGPNQAPIFDPVAPLTVMPGGRVEVDLQAVDPDGDAVTFSIKTGGQELPTGKLQGNGTLVFTPNPEQLGTYEFTLVATDGALKTEQTVTLDVVPDPDTTTRISGRVLDIDGSPLADMPVQLGRLQVMTDADGYFTVVIPDSSLPTDSFNIEIPRGDLQFDPFNTGTAEINLRRTVSDPLSGTSTSNPLRHPNQITTFIDSSAVYGSDAVRAAALRTNDGSGKLKVSAGNLLPINDEATFPNGTLENGNNSQRDPNTLFAAGDVRANENPGLASMHTLLVREHNRLAEDLKANDPSLTGEELYQKARQLVSAQIQQITYSEYLPLLIGDVIPTYSGYDSTVDPTISQLFTAAAFRIGHTQGFSEFLLVDENGQQFDAIRSTSATFNPAILTEHGIDPVLRGLHAQQTQAVDTKVIDEIRNLLFGPPGAGGLDLAAVDIQRGRDVGLPDYNQAREDMGLARVTSFAEITSDVALQQSLEQVYSSVDDIDVIVGGLAEDHQSGAMVGELFQAILKDQFVRLRDGDRFWHENAQLSQTDLDMVRNTTLSSLIARNTGAVLPGNAFSTGTTPTAPGAGGSAATGPVSEYASIDGSGNNLTNPEWGQAGENLGVEDFFTQEYGDGISTPAGEDRANPRTVSNEIFAQSGDMPDQYGSTGFMLMWSQFVAHDLVFSPGGSSDTLRFLAGEIDGNYPFVAEKVDLVLGHEVYEGVNNIIERPIYLPSINAGQTTSEEIYENGEPIGVRYYGAENSALGSDASVYIENGTITDRTGQAFEGAFSITKVPIDLTPAALPPGLRPDLVVTIQPGEMVLTTPAPLTLPNLAGYAPGIDMDLWSINPTTGDFDKVGLGRVSEDGTTVETLEGGIRNSSWHFFAPPAPPCEPEVPDCGCEECEETENFTSSVSLKTGVVMETHDLATYQSVGQTRGVQLRYDSLRADPRQIVNFNFGNIRERFAGMPDMFLSATLSLQGNNGFEYDLPGAQAGEIGGVANGEHFWRLPPQGGRLTTSLQVDLTEEASGRYSFTSWTGIRNYSPNLNLALGSSNLVGGSFVHVNTTESAFGAGWGIAGVQEIVENFDGSVLLIDGDGSELVFEQNADGSYDAPPGDFSTLVKLADGRFQRTDKDQTIYQFNASNKLVSVLDRNGRETQHVYDSNDRLTKIIDPAQLETTLLYNAAGKVETITDPSGRITQLGYDSQGNLTTITDPDNTARSFEYDDEHHMTAETDKRGLREEAFYDEAGRAYKAVRKDGSVIRVSPDNVQGLYPEGSTHSFASAPIAAFRDAKVSTYADGNGNVKISQLDALGQGLTAQDDVGRQGTTRRNAENLVALKSDARGNLTRYRYDERGNVTQIQDLFSSSPNSAGELQQSLVSFENAEQIGLPGNATDIKSADFNQDGSPDLAVLTTSGISVLSLNNGSWETIATYEESIGSGVIEVADLNGDQRPDILNISSSYQTQLLLSSEGTDQLSLASPLGLSQPNNSPQDILVGDFNGDSYLDLVTTSSDNITTRIGRGDGTFSAPLFSDASLTPLPTGSLSREFPQSLAAGDLDNDGDLDFVSLVRGGFAAYQNDGAGNFSPLDEQEIADLSGGGYGSLIEVAEHIKLADLDNDGDLDLVATVSPSNAAHIYLNNGDGTFSDQGFLSTQSSPAGIGTGDFDSDGNIDLALANQGSDSVSLFFGNGDGSFLSELNFNTGNSTQPSEILVQDLNGDGELDIVMTNTSSGASVLFNLPQAAPAVRRYTYDSTFNQLTSMTDELGRQTLYELDPLTGNQRKVTRVVGLLDSVENGETDDVVTKYTYTSYGLVDTVEDALGRITDYDYYDDPGESFLLKQVTYAMGTVDEASQSFEYDAAGNQTAVVDENDNRTEYRYDDMNRLEMVIEADPDGEDGPRESPETAYFYDNAGNQTSVKDARGNVTQRVYDEMGRLTQVIQADPDGEDGPLESPEMTYEYDDHGNQTAIVDPLGRRTEYRYDARNRLTEIVRPDGSSQKMSYNLDNNQTGSRDANQNVTTSTYDSRGRLRQKVDSLNNITKYEYDAANQLTAIIDGNDVRTEYRYDDLGRRFEVKNADGKISSTKYDKVGNVIAEIDELDHRTEFVYDDRNRLTKTIDAENVDLPEAQQKFTEMTYDDVGNLLSIKDPVNNTTSYRYDNLNRMIEDTNELSTQRSYGYDAMGNRTSMTDRNGRERTYNYDALNRLTAENWLDSNDQSINTILSRYDAAGQLKNMSDSSSAYTYTYDLLGRVETVDNAGTPDVPNVLLTYGYDDQGNLTSVTDAIDGVTQNTTSYFYDDLNRMDVIQQTGDGVTDKQVNFTYDGIGQFDQITRFNSLDGSQPGITTDYDYDGLNRLENLTHKNAADQSVAFYNFGYDDANRIEQITDIDGTTDYSYNDRNELTGADHSNDVQNPDETYGYDDNGNRETSSRHGSDYVTGANNQLESDGVYNYFYDNEGNMIRQETIGTGEVRELEWDYRNRLVAVVDSTSGVETQRVEYAYDVLNRRIVKQVNSNPSDSVDGVREHYVYDGDNVLFDFIDSDGDGAAVLVLSQRYLFGPQVDQVLAQESFGSVVWHLTDHLGSVRDLVDDQGQVVNHFVYDSFGNTVTQIGNVDTRYRFTGRELDEEIELYYYRARYYSSNLGRFIAQDPIEFQAGDPNLYSYVYNNPLTYIDASGEKATIIKPNPNITIPRPIPPKPAPPGTTPKVYPPVPLTIPDPKTDLPYIDRNTSPPDPNCKKNKKPCPCESPVQGGSYSNVRKKNKNAGAEVHHMPSWASIRDSGISLKHGRAPAICMVKGDHRRTITANRSSNLRLYTRWKNAEMIRIQHFDFPAAQELGIFEVRRKFGSKYDHGILQMRNYTLKLMSSKPELFNQIRA